MTTILAQQVIHDLSADFHLFISILIPLSLIGVFFTAGAKLMEIKGYQKWPAIFAVFPIFWIVLGWFDPRPEKSRTTTLRLALVFGTLNTFFLGLVILYI